MMLNKKTTSFRELRRRREKALEEFNAQANRIIQKMITLVPRRLLKETSFEHKFYLAAMMTWDPSMSHVFGECVLEFTVEESPIVSESVDALRAAWQDFAKVTCEQLVRHRVATYKNHPMEFRDISIAVLRIVFA